ncbi:hypothetical protein WJX72_006559 [[Myrmecia] bisecta]|uniref:microtubule-severing ATPase n=1 Tax=[Myrmecia] bisecta TaxID=41462 RepID=A0AAW1R7Q2_9CHLO
MRLFKKESLPSSVSDPAPLTAAPARQNAEKLKGYYDLAKDALERAYSSDVGGAYAEAIKGYRMGLQIITEGLTVNVPTSGLGPAHSNVAKWRADMTAWQQHVIDRLRDLESPTASTSAPSPARNITASASMSRPTVARSMSAAMRTNTNTKSRGVAVRPAVPSQPGQRAAARPGTAGQGDDDKFRQMILQDVLDTVPSVQWADVAGLSGAKQALQEMVILPTLRADLFQGLRAPARGLLLYGPPGNGKTMLAKALAHEAKATFFNISAAALTSKWHGEAEKLVRALFKVAAEMQPSIIFIDEIDSILSERSVGEHEASRRLKTQFLVEFDGVANGSERIVLIGATNRPQELDDAVRRRLTKRIYIPLPDAETRASLIQNLLRNQPVKLRPAELDRIVRCTEGYSGSDLAALCREAAMVPIRELGSAITTVRPDKVRPTGLDDFAEALQCTKPSVSRQQLKGFDEWTRQFGTYS